MLIIDQSGFVDRWATSFAQQLSPVELALLAHIGWYFNSKYGLPEEIVGPKVENQPLSDMSDIAVFFRCIGNGSSLSPEICHYLLGKQEIMEWAGSKSHQNFKRDAENIICSLRSSLMLAVARKVDG